MESRRPKICMKISIKLNKRDDEIKQRIFSGPPFMIFIILPLNYRVFGDGWMWYLVNMVCLMLYV